MGHKHIGMNCHDYFIESLEKKSIESNVLGLIQVGPYPILVSAL